MCTLVVACLCPGGNVGSAAAATAGPGYAVSDFATDFYNNGIIGPTGVAFDSSNRLYVMDFLSGYLYRFGPDGGSATSPLNSTPISDRPDGITFDKSGRLYVARQGASDVVEIDPDTGAILRTVASGIPCATGLATDPISGDLFVSTVGCESSILRISDFENGPGRVTAYADPGGAADGLTFAPDGTLYTANQDNYNIVRITGTNSPTPGTATVIANVPTADGVALGAGSDPTQPAYVLVNRNDGAVTKLDLGSSPPAATDIVTGGTRGDFIAVGPDGCLYATQTASVERVTNADGSCSLLVTGSNPELSLSPRVAPPHSVGSSVSFTASLDNVGSPSGTAITFTVTGANPRTVTVPADGAGHAVLTYSGTSTGQDTVVASATVNTTPLMSNTGTVFWYAWASPGAFVVGDSAAIDAYSGYSLPTLDWWGSQWSKANRISGGQAPSAFKGYASSTTSSPPQCGGTWSWTSTGGASSNPPTTVPTYMATIVTSKVTQSGSKISGNIRNIVIVRTGPGYSQGAGHAGSGAIVAVLCGPSLLRTGSFASTGGMQVPRVAHTATLLRNGLVLAVGGYSNGSATPSSELYDPATGGWTPTGSLQTARYLHTATLLPNGKVLVAGGYGFDPSTGWGPLRSSELYDPATGLWSPTGSMQTARFGANAVLLPSGKVLVTGGQDDQFNSTTSAELYDPSTGTWTGTSPLPVGCVGGTSTLLPNGQVLVAGGEDSNFYPLAAAETYTPSTGAWAAVGSMLTSRAYLTATRLSTGIVLVAGGVNANFTPLASAELYDPSTGTWSATGSMQTARYIHTADLEANGLVLVAGGYDQTYTPTASAEVYSPIQGAWHTATSMRSPRAYHTATLLPSGKTLLVGGYDASFASLSSAEVYTP